MRHYIQIGMAVALITAVMGCQGETSEEATDSPSAQASPAEVPGQGAGHTGAVVETMNSAGYTYVQVDTGTEKVWAAAPEFKVAVGDQVTIPPGTPMQNYRSRTLEREFELVYFVSEVTPAGATRRTGQSMPTEMSL